jgi:cell division protein ZapA
MQMTNVTLAIGGRSLTISVAAGEEAHAEMLGRMIDDRVRRLGNIATQGEARMLLFAALMLADELHEVHSRPAPAPTRRRLPPSRPACRRNSLRGWASWPSGWKTSRKNLPCPLSRMPRAPKLQGDGFCPARAA